MLQAKHESLKLQHAALERQRAQLEGEQGALQSTLQAKSSSANAARSSASTQASEHAGKLARAHAELEAIKQDTSSDLEQKASQVIVQHSLYSVHSVHSLVRNEIFFPCERKCQSATDCGVAATGSGSCSIWESCYGIAQGTSLIHTGTLSAHKGCQCKASGLVDRRAGKGCSSSSQEPGEGCEKAAGGQCCQECGPHQPDCSPDC